MVLKRPQSYAADWEQKVTTYIEEYRWAILGDISARLRDEPTKAFGDHRRWARWENAVLSRVRMPDECQTLVRQRQEGIDEDDAERDIVREHFVVRLKERNHNPTRDTVLIPSAVAARWVCEATNDKMPTNKATKLLAGLRISYTFPVKLSHRKAVFPKNCSDRMRQDYRERVSELRPSRRASVRGVSGPA